jgi:hypothetical protein
MAKPKRYSPEKIASILAGVAISACGANCG